MYDAYAYNVSYFWTAKIITMYVTPPLMVETCIMIIFLEQKLSLYWPWLLSKGLYANGATKGFTLKAFRYHIPSFPSFSWILESFHEDFEICYKQVVQGWQEQ